MSEFVAHDQLPSAAPETSAQADEQTRLKVLLIAPWAHPEGVGESWSSFQWIKAAAKYCDVTVLTTRYPTQQSIHGMLQGVELVEWTDKRPLGRFNRLNAGAKPDYIVFYYRARNWLRNAKQLGRHFDVVHQVSPLALRYPSPATATDMPFIIGPLGGSLTTPKAFRDEMSSEPWYVRLRFLDRLRLKWDPLLRTTYQDAAVVIGVAPYVLELLQECRVKVSRFEIMSETGVVALPTATNRTAKEHHGVRLLYVGRIIRTKGLRDIIRAFGMLEARGFTAEYGISLDIVGDGPDRRECEREAVELRVSHLIHFHGRLPRDEVDTFYQSSDVFVFPSFREPSGNVVVEALSHGLPVISARAGGPAHAVDENSGILIDPQSPDVFRDQLAGAIERLVKNRPYVRSLSDGARRRARDVFLWDAKAQWLQRLYLSIQ